MATHAESSHDHYTPGHMVITEQTSTFNGVMGLIKWGSLALSAFLVLLIVTFCTKAGFVPALVSAVLIAVIGGFVLREKPKTGH